MGVDEGRSLRATDWPKPVPLRRLGGYLLKMRSFT